MCNRDISVHFIGMSQLIFITTISYSQDIIEFASYKHLRSYVQIYNQSVQHQFSSLSPSAIIDDNNSISFMIIVTITIIFLIAITFIYLNTKEIQNVLNNEARHTVRIIATFQLHFINIHTVVGISNLRYC